MVGDRLLGEWREERTGTGRVTEVAGEREECGEAGDGREDYTQHAQNEEGVQGKDKGGSGRVVAHSLGQLGEGG